MLPEVRRTFVHDVAAAEVHSARTHAPRVPNSLEYTAIVQRVDAELLKSFWHKAKAILLKAKAKARQSQGQGHKFCP